MSGTIVVDRKAFLSALKIAAAVVPKKSPLPTLNHALINATNAGVTVTATDLDTSICARIEAAATSGQCVCVIGVEQSTKLISGLNADTISLEITDDCASINLGKIGKIPLPSGNISNFPTVAFHGGGNICADIMLSEQFVRTLRRAFLHVSVDPREYRTVLFRILIEFETETANIVAANGCTLFKGVVRDTHASVPCCCTLSKLPITLLHKYMKKEWVATVYEDRIVFSCAEFDIASKLSPEIYPNYKNVVPTELLNSARIKKAELEAAVNAILLFATDFHHIVAFDFAPGTLILSTIEAEQKTEIAVDIDYNGTPQRIGYNAEFVKRVLKSLGDEDIVWKTGATRNASKVCSATSNEEFCLLMPYRLDI